MLRGFVARLPGGGLARMERTLQHDSSTDEPLPQHVSSTTNRSLKEGLLSYVHDRTRTNLGTNLGKETGNGKLYLAYLRIYTRSRWAKATPGHPPGDSHVRIRDFRVVCETAQSCIVGERPTCRISIVSGSGLHADSRYLKRIGTFAVYFWFRHTEHTHSLTHSHSEGLR